MRPGDIVTGINGTVVTSASDVYKAVEGTGSLQLVIRRGRDTVKITVVPEAVQ